MIVDLHAHYPTHLPESRRMGAHEAQSELSSWIRARVLDLANQVMNYDNGQAAVTLATLRAGGIGVALSVLYHPFNEIDLTLEYGAPPLPTYFTDLIALMDAVEADVAAHGDGNAVVATTHADMLAGLAAGKLVLIHAIEGGFHVGSTEADIAANVRELARRGVAYITVAHLFFRAVATNAPAIPFMHDSVYDSLFPQRKVGLYALGEALVRAMIKERILIDVTHMSPYALGETLQLLTNLDPAFSIPVIASHAACKLGNAGYNLDDTHVAAIAQRQGVIGLIACKHWISDGLSAPRTREDSIALLRKHIDRINQVTASYDHIAIGSDLDGFIKPSLPGFETPEGYRALAEALKHAYGAEVAEKICSGNALRVLGWWSRVP